MTTHLKARDGHLLKNGTAHLAKSCLGAACGICPGGETDSFEVDLGAVSFCARSCSEDGEGGGMAEGQGSAAGAVCLQRANYIDPNSHVCSWADSGSGPEGIWTNTSGGGASEPIECPGGDCCTWVGWWTFNGTSCPNDSGEGGDLPFCPDYYVFLTISGDTADLFVNGGFGAVWEGPCDAGFGWSTGAHFSGPAPTDCSSPFTLTLVRCDNPSCGTCTGGGSVSTNIAVAPGATVTVTPRATPCPTTTGCGCNDPFDYCVYHWQAVYNCLTRRWGDVEQVGSTTCSRVPVSYRGTWRRTGVADHLYTYERWEVANLCTGAGDCPDGIPPDLPTDPPALDACCSTTCSGPSTLCYESTTAALRVTFSDGPAVTYCRYNQTDTVSWVDNDTNNNAILCGSGGIAGYMRMSYESGGVLYTFASCASGDGCPSLTPGDWVPAEKRTLPGGSSEPWDGSTGPYVVEMAAASGCNGCGVSTVTVTVHNSDPDQHCEDGQSVVLTYDSEFNAWLSPSTGSYLYWNGSAWELRVDIGDFPPGTCDPVIGCGSSVWIADTGDDTCPPFSAGSYTLQEGTYCGSPSISLAAA
jgi:hypothetical protein